jgi:transposase
MGDRYLRKFPVLGACATLRHRKSHNDAMRLWASGMLERKTVEYKFKLTAVALANKVARIVFALMTRGRTNAGLRSRKEDGQILCVNIRP